MKKRLILALLAVALLASMALTGCLGQDGKAYGRYTGPAGSTIIATGLDTTGGFPSGSRVDAYYEFQEGSYYFYYWINLGGTVYPAAAPTVQYLANYNVTVNMGEFMSDGTDKYFDVYMGITGPAVSGLNRVGAAPTASQLASGEYTQTYSGNGITVTLNVKKVDGSTIPAGDLVTIKK